MTGRRGTLRRRNGVAGRVRPTSRGWTLGASVLVMGLLAALFGLDELWCLAAAGAALLAGAAIWVARQSWEVQVVRTVHPSRVVAGGEAHVELRSRNRSQRRSPPLVATDPFDGGPRSATFAITSLVPGASVNGSYRLPTKRRGVYHLGPMELAASDAFGLFERVRVLSEQATLIVHPTWERVEVSSLSGQGEGAGQNLQPALAASGEDFFTLREYTPGDDLRRVHWPSSARSGDLVVRESESHRRASLDVIADLRAAAHLGDSAEALIGAAASLAMSALRAGLQVRVRTSAGLDTGPIGGAYAAPALLDGLAGSETHGDPGTGPTRPGASHAAGPAAPPPAHPGALPGPEAGASATVILTTDRGEGLGGIGGPGNRAGGIGPRPGGAPAPPTSPSPTVVVFDTTPPPGSDHNQHLRGRAPGSARPSQLSERRDIRRHGGRGRVRVAPGVPFRTAWNAAAAGRRLG